MKLLAIIILACTLSVPSAFACEKKPKHHHAKGISASAVSKSTNRNTNKISNKISNKTKVTNKNDLKSNNELSAKTGDLRSVVSTEREYPAPAQPQYGPTTTSTSYDRGPSFGYTKLEIALGGRVWFNKESLKSLSKGIKAVGEYRPANTTKLKSPTEGWIRLVILDNPQLYPGINEPYKTRQADIKGYCESQSTEYGNNLVGLFASKALEALEDGCNVFIVYYQKYDNWDKTEGGGSGLSIVKSFNSLTGSLGGGVADAEAGRYARSSIGAVGGVDTRILNPER